MNSEKETLEKIKLMLLCGNESQALKHIENYGKFKDKEKYKFAIDFVDWVIKSNIGLFEKYPKKSLEIYKKETL